MKPETAPHHPVPQQPAPPAPRTPTEPAARIGEAAAQRVTSLELFFDLVFVYTLTQLTVLLAHDLSWANAGRVVLIFVVLYWMYGAYAYLTNQVPPDRPARRLVLLLGMAAFLICALSIPRVFDPHSRAGVVFGLGYLLVVVVHTVLYSRSHGRDVIWYGVPNALAALILTAAGLCSGWAVEGLWFLAIVVQFVTPHLAELGPTRRTDRSADELRVKLGTLHPGHFVERHGLLLIVSFGESVVAIGVGIGDLPFTVSVGTGVFLALALAGALWWTYFVRDEDGAEHAFAAVAPERRFRLAMTAYYYAFLPMLLGVAFLAAGVKKSLGHIGEQLHTAPALALAGGVALFLTGDVAFRAAMRLSPLGYRAAAVPVVLVTALFGMRVSALAQLLLLVVALVLMLAAEARWSPSVRDTTRTDGELT
ncbi:low temperature requirement protein A [Streptomyces sp. VRA16 Mangrove soil]|uniref:low temperature requirement protein A n=1 Tax=Streptomyces sp. VRA16 Mangrove soil TaxID=2817434 RepID=UPI001A9FCB5E|nr:low temperature requirement protein A [Streptomyces sp. VRA16 Mangrove soil]MBO1331027.1 low temperature requirement protein A [Streptomyces sp. VRA16 Mangrove soil]